MDVPSTGRSAPIENGCILGRLVPTAREAIALPMSGRSIDVPVTRIAFAAWTGEPIADTYGGKPVLDVAGHPLFAELAILRELESNGWKGVWVDSYSRRMLTGWPAIRGEMDRGPRRMFDGISQLRRGRSWDVFAWCDDKVLFAEAKRRGKDAIRDQQRAWLEAALERGLTPTEFLLVEWSLA